MLSKEENELLSRVGPGTPMGDLMRQYWLPAALSSELPSADSNPLRVLLLGEQLIAFRDSNGKIGLLANNCPHRGASLFFGRNEEAGLRCVYHGWKFDASGQCIDMPNEPAESDFKQKVKAVAYPTRERGGIVWAYMGPKSEPPPLPELEPNMLPDGEWTISVYQRECNWMQALEGDIDTSHTVFLHTGSLAEEDAPEGSWARYALADRAPRFEVVPTDAGVMYTAYRPAESDSIYYRIAQFLFPFYAMVPTGVLGLEVRVRAWIPMDDQHTLALTMAKTGVRSGTTSWSPQNMTEAVPNSTGWLDRFRCVANASNDYQIDRQAQRSNESYTGIPSIFLQDQAVTESMGPIYKRWEEHLGTSDAMIIRTRRRLIDAARALRDQGSLPPGTEDPSVYAVRSGGVVVPRGVSWVEATSELRKAFVNHPGLSREVLGGIPAV
jgi:phenylpropionate dioxygenase-like ring-hydroxylating dioxygenase large terminal subunit